jgi:hypothetical protein
MGIELLFRNNIDFSIGVVKLDLLMGETHDRTSTITDNPIEDGAVVSDHIQNDPVNLSIEGYITNTPISLFRNLNTLINPFDRVQDVFDSLELFWEFKTILQVVTNLKVYEDMAIESLSIPKDKNGKNDLEFSIDFKKVTKLTRETVQIPASIVGGGRRNKALAQSRVKGGKKAPGAAADNSVEKQKSRSILSGILGIK